jgi:hypothetical protein
MTKIFNRSHYIAATLCVFMMQPLESNASGEIYKRVVSDTNMAKCGTGKIVEYLHTGGNVHGFFSNYILACLKSETAAEWVLISGTFCDDPSERERHDCNGQRARVTPNFVQDGEFWKAEPVAGKVKIGYDLIKYGFGTNCRSVVQKYKMLSIGGYDSEQTAWVCDSLNLQDGSTSDYTPITDPRKFKLFHLTTSGRYTLKTFYPEEPFPSKGDESYSPALNFIVPDTNYIFDVRKR